MMQIKTNIIFMILILLILGHIFTIDNCTFEHMTWEERTEDVLMNSKYA